MSIPVPIIIDFLIDKQSASNAGKQAKSIFQNQFNLTEKDVESLIKQVETALKLVEKLKILKGIDFTVESGSFLRGRNIKGMSPGTLKTFIDIFANIPNQFRGFFDFHIAALESDLFNIEKLIGKSKIFIKDTFNISDELISQEDIENTKKV